MPQKLITGTFSSLGEVIKWLDTTDNTANYIPNVLKYPMMRALILDKKFTYNSIMLAIEVTLEESDVPIT